MSYNNRILKFQSGGTPKEETIGNYIRRSRGVLGGFEWYDTSNRNSKLTKEIQVGNWILKPNGTKVHITARKANTQAARNNTQSDTDSSSLVAFSPVLPEFRDEYKNEEKTAQQSTTTTKTGRTGRTGKSTVKVTPKGQAYWDKQYQDFKSKMTDDQKAWLDQKGIDYSSAEQLQGYLSRINKNIDQSFVDNKWGGDSQKAWEDFVNTTMKNNPLQTPVKEPVIDAPDPFGYKTSNTYENADFVSKLKEMGIRSNADLMHFMYESGKEGWKGDAWQTQFRNDVDRLLGGDYSDDNIKKVFKTKNSWGIGFTGRGDFGDFQNVLQTNAGLWNGAHDQKELASRTDSDGNVYSNSNVAKLFDKQSISSKIADIKKYKFPDLDFNLKQGNIGISTLGNQPGMFDAANYEGVV